MNAIRVLIVVTLTGWIWCGPLAGRASAQYNTAEMFGVVKDAQGGVLPGATVVALHPASGTRIERSTDQEGRFFLPALPVGDYELSIELSGFKRFVQSGLTLRVGQKIEIPIILEIGTVSDAVTVTAETPLLRVANAEIGEIVDNRQVE